MYLGLINVDRHREVDAPEYRRVCIDRVKWGMQLDDAPVRAVFFNLDPISFPMSKCGSHWGRVEIAIYRESDDALPLHMFDCEPVYIGPHCKAEFKPGSLRWEGIDRLWNVTA